MTQRRRSPVFFFKSNKVLLERLYRGTLACAAGGGTCSEKAGLVAVKSKEEVRAVRERGVRDKRLLAASGSPARRT